MGSLTGGVLAGKSMARICGTKRRKEGRLRRHLKVVGEDKVGDRDGDGDGDEADVLSTKLDSRNARVTGSGTRFSMYASASRRDLISPSAEQKR